MKTLLAVCLLMSVAALGLGIRAARPSNNVSPEALKVDLADTQRRLRAAEAKVAELSARMDALQIAGSTFEEKKSALLVAKEASPAIQTGESYSVGHDAIIYGSDVKLRAAKDVTVSSPTGVMVSDLNQKMVVGDLTMETPTETMQADGAVVDVSNHSITAKSMSITPKKQPNQPPEPTPMPVTPPAAQEPRQP